MTAQTWTVLEWDCQDGGLLGAVIVCVQCVGTGCEMCDGDGQLFQPYRLPNGAPIDLWGDAEILIQIEPPERPHADDMSAPEPYCCAQHALCNVDLPGGDGEHARRQFAELSATAADSWCGETRGAHGAIVVSDDLGLFERFVALGGRVQWVKP